mmetsp:Transcript_63035/g.138658  ORF Transcript_63035/g.138658 Transcript_63035/m.138658 type:complete len:301 (-) Transcript_63035:4-906(-)
MSKALVCSVFGLCFAELFFCSRGLQRHQPVQIDPLLQAVMPIEWVHVIKAGSSFVNTLINIPGVCPGIDEDLAVTYKLFGGDRHHVLEHFMEQYNPSANCNAAALDTDPQRLLHGSIDYRPGFDQGKGRFMMFMRQPEQRLLSQYTDDQRQYLFEDTDPKLELYKVQWSGITTKMLARADPWPEEAFQEPPSQFEMETAKTRLSTGFSFIGITEQWDLSLCLFNAMFNQPCRSIQFLNSHPTQKDSISTYDTTRLNGWRDPYDNELFDVAMEIFERNLKKYNVSETSCKPCWHEAGLSTH